MNGITLQCSPTDGGVTSCAGAAQDSKEFEPLAYRSSYSQQVSPGAVTPTGYNPVPVNLIRPNAIQVSGWSSTRAAVLQPMPPACATPTGASRDVECDPYNFISSPRHEGIPTTPSSSSSSVAASPLPYKKLHFETYVKNEASATPTAKSTSTGKAQFWNDHLPVPLNLYSNGLRKMGWCGGFCPKRGKKTAMVCSTCGVMLCIDCYAFYHRSNM